MGSNFMIYIFKQTEKV